MLKVLAFIIKWSFLAVAFALWLVIFLLMLPILIPLLLVVSIVKGTLTSFWKGLKAAAWPFRH